MKFSQNSETVLHLESKSQVLFGLTVFFSASISQLRDWICLLDSFASCLACLRASVLRFADSVKSVNCRNKRSNTGMKVLLHTDAWLSCVSVCLPWTCTSPQILACSLRRWSHIGPWCPSEHQLDQAWSCCPPPSSAAGFGHSPAHPGFPDNKRHGEKCSTI